MKRTAIFDEHRMYRYSLIREWDHNKDNVAFIMLNPSTAGEQEDDPTTKRCIQFAKKFGFGSLEIVNLFAYITPDPNILKGIDPELAIGDENYNHIVRALNGTDKIIAAWGENGTIHHRNKEVEEIIEGYNIDCLGELTRDSHPRHPLYLSNDVELLPFKRPIHEVHKLVRTVPYKGRKSMEGILIKDNKEVFDDSWMWCESCHGEFSISNTPYSNNCYQELITRFKDFLRHEYHLGEGSVNDYVGRFKGIVNSGIFMWEKEMTPQLENKIIETFSRSKSHYVLTMNRYFDFQQTTKMR